MMTTIPIAPIYRRFRGEDEVILVNSEGRTVDAVRWDREYFRRVAMQLSLDKFATTSNTSIMNCVQPAASIQPITLGLRVRITLYK